MTSDYYAQLSCGYADNIRQLVPTYDEMTQSVLDALGLFAPHTLLDIGAGVGDFTYRVLARLAQSQIVAVEACDEMLQAASQTLAPFVNRSTLVHRDILDFEPVGKFEGIYSNLVLHNLVLARTRDALERVYDWLAPGGVFVWGDLIRYSEPRVQAHFVAERIAFARDAGCSEELIRQSFLKEERDDHPMTVKEMLDALECAGFDEPQCLWCHDTFAILMARK